MNFTKDFSKKTISALATKGVYIYGTTWIPDASGSCANGETAYQVDDNSTSRVLRFSEVLALAESTDRTDPEAVAPHIPMTSEDAPFHPEQFWCECKDVTPDEWRYVDDGARNDCRGHHWRCTRCDHVLQIG